MLLYTPVFQGEGEEKELRGAIPVVDRPVTVISHWQWRRLVVDRGK